MMRGRVLTTVILFFIGAAMGIGAEEVYFEEGRVAYQWVEGDVFSLGVRLEEGRGETASSEMWVVTLLADRFANGVFAWQLHYGEAFQNVLVVPNDFLTARKFSLEQLGIEVEHHQQGLELVLRIPCSGPLPALIAVGDRIAVHALWLQQEPLVVLDVRSEPTAVVEGGGGVSETQEMVPPRSTYEQGEPIRHRFTVRDPETGDIVRFITASYTLLRVREGRSDEFVRFSHITRDPETGAFEYEIDTTKLREGEYRLIVAWSPNGETAVVTLRIIAPSSN